MCADVSVAAGNDFTCGLTKDGGIDCFGGQQYSQRSPPPSTDFASLSLGESHGCAVAISATIQVSKVAR